MTNKKNNLFSLGIVILAVFILSALGISAQSSEVEDKLSETKKSVEEFLDLKDNSSISSEDKAKAEVISRKKVISNVIDLSRAQIEDLKKRLDLITLPESDDWKLIKELFIKNSDEFIEYYKKSADSLNSLVTLDEIKNFAKSIEEKKISQIDVESNKINNVIVAFGMSDVLKLADERLKKVSLDVNKIYDKKLTKSQALMDLYKKSSKMIDDAHNLNDRSKEIMLNVYSTSDATSTVEFIKKLKDEIADLKKKESINKLPATVKEDNTKDEGENIAVEIKDSDIDSYLQDLTFKTLSNIKTAYGIFIDMSVNVKKYIK